MKIPKETTTVDDDRGTECHDGINDNGLHILTAQSDRISGYLLLTAGHVGHDKQRKSKNDTGRETDLLYRSPTETFVIVP